LSERTTLGRILGRYDGPRPQFRDQPQDVDERMSRKGDLGHLEGDVAGIADDLRADFYRLIASSSAPTDSAAQA
jgi:hypothetical protein